VTALQKLITPTAVLTATLAASLVGKLHWLGFFQG
jgi:hypothetical protein